jgi:DHA2 family multidrug resistance protein
LFILFSMSCAWATDLNMMIVLRALQGFTGGILIPMALTIIMTTLPQSKRPVGMAIFAISATFAPSIGPAVGGFLTDSFGWQYIFYLNLLPGLMFLTILWLTLPKEPMKLELLREGDWFGILTMATGLGCLEVVLEEGNRKDWFGSEFITTLFVIAVVSLSLFIWRQLTAKKPLINIRLFGRRNFGLGSVANIALGFGLYGSVYLLPTYLAQMQHYSAWQIGETMVWLGLPQLLIIPLVPKLMQRIDPRLLLGTGIALFAISCLMNAFMTIDNAGPQLIVSLLVRALGQPLIIVPLSTLSTGDIEVSQSSSASALFNMMRNLGGSIGVALISTFLTQREHLHSVHIGESIYSASAAVQERLSSTTAYLISRGADAAMAQQQATAMIDNLVRQQSYLMAYNDTFLIVGITLLSSVAAVALLKRPKALASAGAGAH